MQSVSIRRPVGAPVLDPSVETVPAQAGIRFRSRDRRVVSIAHNPVTLGTAAWVCGVLSVAAVGGSSW